ncbi:MAG: peptide chain release factor N(5)-glutamine methyltransferase [Bacteroidales bacterium]|nr:peptide chain release factor N(5)-glutamine methyltransferase [Bacteroidales bacterium]
MTLKAHIDSITASLEALYPREEAHAIAVRTVTGLLSVPEYKHLSEPETEVDADKEALLEDAAKRLAAGEPMQYVLGYTWFAGLRIRVGSGVLIPRPETEQLYELAAEDCDNLMSASEDDSFNILDICTGSGALAYAFASEFPEAHVYGCDISDDALRYASRQRVKLHGARPVIFKADVMQAPPAGLPKFDLIVSNPPYVTESEKGAMRPNVLDWEPELALFVSDDDPLAYYRAVAVWADALLKDNGSLWLEINERFGEETAALFTGAALIQDINGKDRFIVVKK